MIIPNLRELFIKKVFFVALAVVIIFALSFQANASFLSLFEAVSQLPTGKKFTNLHSQNMPLLVAAINHDPNPAKGGGDITIIGGSSLMPDSGPLGTLADVDTVIPKSDQISVYVVREGDTLTQIAQMFGVSANTIYWGNDIKWGGLIKPGQTLVILPLSGVRHIIKEGETIESIASKYKADVDEILDYNEFTSSKALVVGKTIIVPNGKLGSSAYNIPPKVWGTSGPSYSGYLLRPVAGGRRSQGLHGYNSVDLAVAYGSPIVAAAAGEVVISRTGWNGGYGNYVVIKHANGVQTVYAHNSSNIVYSGQSVYQGQVIGYVGSTGRSTGPHVHFEVRGAQNPF